MVKLIDITNIFEKTITTIKLAQIMKISFQIYAQIFGYVINVINMILYLYI